MSAVTGRFDRIARRRERGLSVEELIARAKAELAAFLVAEEKARRTELERTLAVERANAGHLLAEQERQLAEERRALVANQIEQARADVVESLATAQTRLEQRLAGWLEDIERAQRAREADLAELGRRQEVAIAAYDARLRANAEQLAAATEEQRSQLTRLREDLERLAHKISEEAVAEIETHAAERRRALEEVGDRLRSRERSLREQIEREEADALGRLAAAIAAAERRQLEHFGRALERASSRVAEEAERRFDEQVKQSRDKSAERLARELEKAMEGFASRAEKDVADRIAAAARSTADRLQRRLDDMARAAEVQQDAVTERVRLISERLEETLTHAEARMKSFEEQIEAEVGRRLSELERLRGSGS
jgi:uncharacterized protein YukE